MGFGYFTQLTHYLSTVDHKIKEVMTGKVGSAVFLFLSAESFLWSQWVLPWDLLKAA